MRQTILSILILVSIVAKAQSDYLITLKGDTLTGTVEILQNKYYDEVAIRNNQGKELFKIFQLEKVFMDGKEFKMVTYNNRQVAGQIQNVGTVSLFMIQTEDDHTFSTRYLIKESGDNLIVPNIGFRKYMAEFFNDCGALSKKINNKEFTSNNLGDIIHFYNQRCESDNKLLPAEMTVLKEETSLTELAQLLLDIQAKLDENGTVPSYMIDALESFSSMDVNKSLQDLIQKLKQ